MSKRTGAICGTFIFAYHGQTIVNIDANTLCVMHSSTLSPTQGFYWNLISNYLHVKFYKTFATPRSLEPLNQQWKPASFPRYLPSKPIWDLKYILFPPLVLFLHFNSKVRQQRSFTFFLCIIDCLLSPQIKLLYGRSWPLLCLRGCRLSEHRNKAQGMKVNVLVLLHC